MFIIGTSIVSLFLASLIAEGNGQIFSLCFVGIETLFLVTALYREVKKKNGL